MESLARGMPQTHCFPQAKPDIRGLMPRHGYGAVAKCDSRALELLGAIDRRYEILIQKRDRPSMEIRPQFPDEQSPSGEFTRQPDAFRGWVTADGSLGYRAEPGRYHLYVSWACPGPTARSSCEH